MRGYGRSSLPTADSYAHTDDLAALFGHLGVESAHIVGLSAGGRNALRFALAFPQRVRSLTLTDSALDGYTWSAEWQAQWNAIDSQAKSGDLLGAKRMWLEHPLFTPAREHATVALNLSHMVYAYSGWHWINVDPGLAPETPAINCLANVRARTLVITGDKNLPDFQRIADILMSGIPGASRVVIPGSGHMTNMEAPAAFNDALLKFLA